MSSEDVFQVLDKFVSSQDVPQLLQHYRQLVDSLQLQSLIGSIKFFIKLKTILFNQRRKCLQKYQRIHQILTKLDKRQQMKCYSGPDQACSGQRCLVIGGGISGLRVAIELLFLKSAEVLVVEKRISFSRNNVIHLWPNVIQDMRQLGGKRFYPKFCYGAIDHVAIRSLQLMLLKISLLLGVRFEANVQFDKLCPRLTTTATTAVIDGDDSRQECCCRRHGFGDGAVCHFLDSITGEEYAGLNGHFFDVIIGSDGRRNTLFQDFPRKEFRGKLAIAVTANFVNRRSEAESRVEEISGVSYIYNQKWFKRLNEELGIQLENVCYYRDETHYFVMTATKSSLLKRKVLIRDLNDTNALLSDDNIDREQLLYYAKDAAEWTSGLTSLEFALNANQSADVALFDFTSVYAAKNASRAKRVRLTCCDKPLNGDSRATRHVLMMLTGDSLLEPFWPTGSGAGRGFLSALDAAYTALQWTRKVVRSDVTEEAELWERMSDVIAERESVYRLLAQTTPENIQSKEFSLFPEQRYQNWNRNSVKEVKLQISHLIGLNNQPISEQSVKRARRATVAVTSRDLELVLNEKRREEEKEREVELEAEFSGERAERRRALNEKEAWLLGQQQQRQEALPVMVRPKKKEEIVSRAQELEKVLNKVEKFEGKLQKVGKIEAEDWNFRVWEKNTNFNKEKMEKKMFDSKKEILESRRQQIEEKLKESQMVAKKDNLERQSMAKRNELEGQFVRMIGEELSERMGQKSETTATTATTGDRQLKTTADRPKSRTPEPKLTPKTTPKAGERQLTTSDRQAKTTPERQPRPKSRTPEPKPKSVKRLCVRCGLEVSAVERIQVSGDVLHRSCLRCSKCGISLRLNEFRNELKFLCVFCVKNNAKNVSEDNLKAKQKFLSSVDSVDFRRRSEDNSNRNSIEIIAKTALNAEEEEAKNGEVEEELTFDSTTDDNSDVWQTEDDDDEWTTTTATSSDDSDDDDDRQRQDDRRQEIPSICVTKEPPLCLTTAVRDDDTRRTPTTTTVTTGHRYSGQFTEKLFRSKSQPLLVWRRLNSDRRGVAAREDTEEELDFSDSELPFADIAADISGQHFSPVRSGGQKAPIIEFKDI